MNWTDYLASKEGRELRLTLRHVDDELNADPQVRGWLDRATDKINAAMPAVTEDGEGEFTVAAP